MNEEQVLALLKSINIKIEALQSQMVMFQEALQPDLEYTEVKKENIEITEEVLMDLSDVIFMAESTKAVLVVKKGFQKWVALSLIEEPKEYQLGFQGNIILRKKKDSEKVDPENWFHKKAWEKFKPQKKGG